MGQVEIFKNKNWQVAANSSLRSGLVDGKYHGTIRVLDHWIILDDHVKFETPEMIPQYIKDKITEFLFNQPS